MFSAAKESCSITVGLKEQKQDIEGGNANITWASGRGPVLETAWTINWLEVSCMGGGDAEKKGTLNGSKPLAWALLHT